MPEIKSLELVQTNNALIPAEILDAYSVAMDQALGLQKTSLTAVSEWNAQAMELAWQFAPLFCDLYSLTVRAFAGYAQWARLLAGLPCASSESGRLQLAGGPTVLQQADDATMADTLARCMDVAVGAEPVADPQVEVLSFAAVLKAPAQLPPAKPVRSAEADEAAEAVELAIGHVA